MLHCCPEVLSVPQRVIDSTVRVLRDKCLFTVQQVTEVLHRCPYVLREDPGELEYKFQVRWPGVAGERPWAFRLSVPGLGHGVRDQWWGRGCSWEGPSPILRVHAAPGGNGPFKRSCSRRSP